MKNLMKKRLLELINNNDIEFSNVSITKNIIQIIYKEKEEEK